MKQSLKIIPFDSRVAGTLLKDTEWSELAVPFGLPDRTTDGVSTRALIGEIVKYHRDEARSRDALKGQHGSQRRRRRQLGAIARYRKTPQAIPALLLPEVVSLLACRLIVNRRLTGSLAELMPEMVAEVRGSTIVTPELRRAAWEVKVLGAFRREYPSIGKRNEDRPGRLLISHAANFWRFGLGRPVTLSRSDGRPRMRGDELGYSRFTRFVHALFRVAGENVSIEAIFKRLEDALKAMFASEKCEFGCGFSVLSDKAVPTVEPWRLPQPIPPEVVKAGRIVVPGFSLMRAPATE
jgi:hypothetical protein